MQMLAMRCSLDIFKTVSSFQVSDTRTADCTIIEYPARCPQESLNTENCSVYNWTSSVEVSSSTIQESEIKVSSDEVILDYMNLTDANFSVGISIRYTFTKVYKNVRWKFIGYVFERTCKLILFIWADDKKMTQLCIIFAVVIAAFSPLSFPLRTRTVILINVILSSLTNL